MISRASKYALNVLRSLARAPADRLSAAALADETGAAPNYLSKILNQLRKQGLVEAEKGWGGGFRIRPDALDRPLREVVAIFDGQTPMTDGSCLLELSDCNEDDPCPLHPFWQRIREVMDELLTTQTIRDLATRPTAIPSIEPRGPDE